VTLYAIWTPNDYHVTYTTDGALSGIAPTDDVIYHIDMTFAARDNVGSLARDGYDFDGWYVNDTNGNGAKTYYAVGEEITVGSSDITLYPNWKAIDYTVTYDANGALYGTAPTNGISNSEKSIYHIGDDVNTLGQADLLKTGYHFTGWNTNPDGTGIAYAANTTKAFEIGNSSVTLYAVWSENETYTVHFDTDGGEPFTIPSRTNVKWSSQTLISSIKPVRIGYDFTGWKLAKLGDVDVDADQYLTADYIATSAAFSELAGVDTVNAITLKANYEEKNNFSVKYDLNDGTINGSMTIDSLTDVTWSSADLTPLTLPVRDGYIFTGWNVDANGHGTNVNHTAKYCDLADNDLNPYLILKASWTKVNTYSVKYDLNGATSANVADQIDLSWSATNLLPVINPSKDGYVFAEWKIIDADGHVTNESVNLTAQSTYSQLAGNDKSKSYVTLQAQWTEKGPYTVVYDLGGSEEEPVSVTAIATGDAQITIPTKTGIAWSDAELLPTDTTLTRLGYKFTGWNVDKGGYRVSVKATDSYGKLAYNDDTTEITLIATWTLDGTYSVKYDLNGGSIKSTNTAIETPQAIPDKTGVLIADGALTPKIIEEETKEVESIVPVREGYDFVAWNVSEYGFGTDVKDEDLFEQLAENSEVAYITLLAEWQPKAFTVLYYDEIDADDSEDSDDMEGVNLDVIQTVIGTLKPVFDPKENVTWWSADLLPEEAIPSKAGNIFLGWTLIEDEMVIQEIESKDVQTLSALSVLSTFAPISLLGDSSARIVTTIDPYKALAKSDAQPVIRLLANWQPKDYTVTYDTLGANSGNIADKTVKWKTSSLLPDTEPTKTGYTFKGWRLLDSDENVLDDLITDTAAYSNLVAADDTIMQCTLQAVWEINVYRVTFVDADGNAHDAQDVQHGADAVLPPSNPTQEGYTFIGWEKNYNNITDDTIVKPIFEVIEEPDEPGDDEDKDRDTDKDRDKKPDDGAGNDDVDGDLNDDNTSALEEQPRLVNRVVYADFNTSVDSFIGLVFEKASSRDISRLGNKWALVVVEEPLVPDVDEEPGITAEQKAELRKEVRDRALVDTPVDDGDTSSWALFNLIFAIGGAILAIIALVSLRKKRREDDSYEGENSKRHTKSTVLSVFAAIFGIVVFVLTENVLNPMILVDKWTVLMAITFAVGVVCAFIALQRGNREDEQDSNVEN
jgi:uncharacterized repeat protein (TIGR02543 family)